jgi:very-short-patch-repair endonuclease
MFINNKANNTEKRKSLRKNMTDEEVILWSFIKNSKLCNTKFRRQHSNGCYILDFYAPLIKLCIELDGSQHFSTLGIGYDNIRTEYLNSCGIRVLRFTNRDIRTNLNGVLVIIGNEIEQLKG